MAAAASVRPRNPRDPRFPLKPNKTHAKTSRRGPGTPGPTEEMYAAFLAVLATPTGTPAKAAAAIGVDYRTPWRWREKDEDFAERWRYAVEEGTDHLEGEAKRRAHDGYVASESFDKDTGQLTHQRIEYSDSLMNTILKGRRPEVYRDKVEHSGSVEVQHSVEVTFVKGTKK